MTDIDFGNGEGSPAPGDDRREPSPNAVEDLRLWAVKYTGCSVQDRGWPCGTCMIPFLEALGVQKRHQNTMWRSFLNIRGDKDA